MNLAIVDGIVVKVDSRSFGNGGEVIEIHLTNQEEKWNKDSKRMEAVDVPLMVTCFGKLKDEATKIRTGDYVMAQGKMSGRYSEGKNGQRWHNSSVVAVSLRRVSADVSGAKGRDAGSGEEGGDEIPF